MGLLVFLAQRIRRNALALKVFRPPSGRAGYPKVTQRTQQKKATITLLCLRNKAF